MSNLVPPHGADSLKPLLLPEIERAEEMQRAGRLKQVPLFSREVSDLFMFGMGAYTPLDGFMGKADWRSCCEHMQRADGLFWPIPITLSCAQELGDSIGIGEDVALIDSETDELLGILAVEEKYAIDRDFECSHVFRTTDTAHPGVAKVMSQGPVNLGGPVRTLSEGHLVKGGGLPDAQPDAPQPRAPGQDRDRDL
jgi:sulfate adenylyltransferase